MNFLSVKRVVAIVIAIIVLVPTGFYLAGKYKAHANAKAIAFISNDQMARYNDLDRQVSALRLQIQIIEQVDKKAIRDQLGVPAEFVERRLDPNSFNSSVVEFVEKPVTQGK